MRSRSLPPTATWDQALRSPRTPDRPRYELQLSRLWDFELLLPDALLPSLLRAELPVQPSVPPLPQAPRVIPIEGTAMLRHGATRSSSRSSSGIRCLICFLPIRVLRDSCATNEQATSVPEARAQAL